MMPFFFPLPFQLERQTSYRKGIIKSRTLPQTDKNSHSIHILKPEAQRENGVYIHFFLGPVWACVLLSMPSDFGLQTVMLELALLCAIEKYVFKKCSFFFFCNVDS